MIYPEYDGNPFAQYLLQEHLMPGDFACMADVDQNKVYDVMRARVRTLPRRFVEAIEERSGSGTGAKLGEAYRFYREDLRASLLKNP